MLPLKIEQIRMPWAGLLDESDWRGTTVSSRRCKGIEPSGA